MKLQYLLLVVMIALLSACVAPVAPEAASDQPAADSAASDEAVDDEAVTDGEDHEQAAGMLAGLGDVDFAVSCTPEAQAAFNHAMAILHSFEYATAIDAFKRVAELDPSCAMAHWGVAMSLVEPLWAPPTGQMLAEGWAAVEQARAAGAATPREQAYIDAIAAFFEDSDTVAHGTRLNAHAEAMAQLVQDYPDDAEAQIFYALALVATASPTDKDYTNQRQAVDILEQVFVEQPNHPGVTHYLIHSNDYPALAEQGLDAALRYADIAPDAPHALHMPSHIFTRLGYWQDSIDTNIASVNTAKANLTASDGQIISSQAVLHPLDYIMYGYLQLGQDENAQALLEEVNAIDSVPGEVFGAAYALAAMPARYVLERGQWGEAAALALHPPSFGWERFPHAEATLVFARGLGAARAGDADAARQELERLHELREAVAAMGDNYWAGQVDIQAREVEAWLALAEGNDEDALTLMQEAVELEAATEKHPVTPGPIAPARELLGEMLLALDQPADALAEFEASLRIEPNRFRSLYGAAHAADLAGEMETARSFYEALRELAASTDSERAEIAEAEAFLAQ